MSCTASLISNLTKYGMEKIYNIVHLKWGKLAVLAWKTIRCFNIVQDVFNNAKCFVNFFMKTTILIHC